MALNSRWLERPALCFKQFARVYQRLSQINQGVLSLLWVPRPTEPTNLCHPAPWAFLLGMVVPLITCHFWPPQVYAPERDEHVKSAAAAAALGPAASYLCTPEAHGNASRGLWP